MKKLLIKGTISLFLEWTNFRNSYFLVPLYIERKTTFESPCTFYSQSVQYLMIYPVIYDIKWNELC